MKLLLIAFFILFSACSSNKNVTTTDDSQNAASWPGKMRDTAESFQQLLPYIYNAEKFSAPKNRSSVEKKIERFSKSIHNIETKRARKLLGDDPYILQSLEQLKDFSSRAKDVYSKGDFKHSRILLKATTDTCFKCHTRVKFGPESYYWKNFNVNNIDTNPLEKAHILVSMRQYAEAKLYIKKHISELELEDKYGLSYENAIKYYLMISLRGQNTIEQSKIFIQSKILNAKVPTEFHYSLKHWLKDLKYWDKNSKELTPTLASAKQVLQKSKNPNSERNTVNNLLASSLLHTYLMNEKQRKNKAQAYYLLGNIYDTLILAGFWDLPEVYYEMCIKYSPKSNIAKKCYNSYRDNIVIGYSGSRGTLIPNYEYERLETLKKQAGL